MAKLPPLGVRCRHCGAPRPPGNFKRKDHIHNVTLHRLTCAVCGTHFTTAEIALPERPPEDRRRVDFAALARAARGDPP